MTQPCHRMAQGWSQLRGCLPSLVWPQRVVGGKWLSSHVGGGRVEKAGTALLKAVIIVY